MFTREQKFLIANLALIQFNHIVDFMIPMPLGPQLMRLFAIGPSEFGLLVSSYTFWASISSLAASVFVDRYDRKSTLLLFFAGFTLSTFACALAPTYAFLLIARSIAGFFGGVLTAMVMSIMSDAVPYSKRGTAMGLLTTAFSLASIVGVPFSLYLANTFSWHAPFVFLGLLCLVNLSMIWWRIPSMKSHLVLQTQVHPLRPVLDHLTRSQSLIPLFFSFFLVMGQFTVIPFLSPSLVANAGLTEAQLPLIYLVGGATSITTGPLIGYLSDRLGKHKVFWLTNTLCLIPLLLLTHIREPMALWVLLPIIAMLFMFIGGRMNPAMALVSGSVEPYRRGSFMSLVSSAQQMASAVASFVASRIITKSATGQLENYHYVGYIAVAFSLAAFVLSLRMRAVEPQATPVASTN